MKITRLIIVMATVVCGIIVAGMLMPGLAPWLARESVFEFTAREPKNRNSAESGAAHGGPATPSGDLGVTDEPPSIN